MIDRMDKMFTDDEVTFADQIAEQMNSVMHLPQTKYNVTDDTDMFQVALDLPGVEPSDIDINVEDNVLTMKGKREVKNKNFASTYKFYQSFTMDDAIDKDNITAELKDGVLRISAPKISNLLEESAQEEIAPPSATIKIKTTDEESNSNEAKDIGEAPKHEATATEIKQDLEKALKKMK